MVTRNFKALLGRALCVVSSYPSGSENNNKFRTSLLVHDIYNGAYYLVSVSASGVQSFPGQVVNAVNVGGNYETNGIWLGTGNRTPSEDDYDLQSTITAGISASVSDVVPGLDEDGDPCLTYTIAVTNTGSDSITISEVGYRQNAACSVIKDVEATTSVIRMGRPLLLDRTVLESPLTLASNGDAGSIIYTLKTAINGARTVNGVKIVSWESGSDEDVAAMIDAAQQGLINLQTDGGWQLGMQRWIHLNAWEGAKNSHEAEDLVVVISSFDDYNNCGAVMQFDFCILPYLAEHMNSTNTNTGGYGASVMYTTTLPAMVNALPSWLSSRLKTFSVLASAGSDSSEIATVANNKLALRSEVEIFNTTSSSYPGEGSQIALFSSVVAASRVSLGRLRSCKIYLTASALGSMYWLRSPSRSSVRFAVGNADGLSSLAYGASSSYYVAPFGCL